MKKFSLRALTAAALLAFAGTTWAQPVVNVGVSVSATGPAASLGIPEQNVVEVMPKEVDGVKINYIVLDDATDTANAVRNMRKLISEHNIDIMVGSTITAASLGLVDVAGETKIPLISLNGNAVVVTPTDGAKKWAFKTAQNDSLMAAALIKTMQKQGVKTLGFIGFADAYGQSWLKEMTKALESTEIKIVASESYARTDTSVTGQVMKLIAAKPDAILVGTAGTPGALPQRELIARGFKGQTYHTHGSANNDFLRVCAKACENVILPVGPVMVAEQLEDDNPVKAMGLTLIKLYNDKFGANTFNAFAGHMWDAGRLIESAIPRAIASDRQPGTERFRAAVRDALEQSKDIGGVHGIFNMSPTDHAGLDARARVMVKIIDGKWVYQPDLLK